mgnify:FL=1
MTKVYDFSVTDIREHNFEFAEMTVSEIEEKKRILEEFQKTKVTPAPQVLPTQEKTDNPAPAVPKPGKPVFRPKIKPPGTGTS